MLYTHNMEKHEQKYKIPELVDTVELVGELGNKLFVLVGVFVFVIDVVFGVLRVRAPPNNLLFILSTSAVFAFDTSPENVSHNNKIYYPQVHNIPHLDAYKI